MASHWLYPCIVQHSWHHPVFFLSISFYTLFRIEHSCKIIPVSVNLLKKFKGFHTPTLIKCNNPSTVLWQMWKILLCCLHPSVNPLDLLPTFALSHINLHWRTSGHTDRRLNWSNCEQARGQAACPIVYNVYGLRKQLRYTCKSGQTAVSQLERRHCS